MLLVAAPLLIFALGQAMGPLLGRGLLRLIDAVAARVQLGAWRDGRDPRAGVILAREVLERIVPGKTTLDEVIRLCGAPGGAAGAVPGLRAHDPHLPRAAGSCRSPAGSSAGCPTVRHWDVERQEVRIEIEGDTVRDVRADIRRYRLGLEEPR